MANINITIKNLPQIKRAFGLAPALMTQELNKAIKKTVFQIQPKSMRNTPVDSGRLRSSHTTSFSNLSGSLFTNTNYDMFVHDGTRYMVGRPYMRDAVEGSTQDVDRNFTEATQKVLNKIGNMT